MRFPLVIAEAGVNHNGDVARAIEMVSAAADAGADYVKFQAFRAENLVAVGAPTAAYQASATGLNDQVALLQPLELSRSDYDGLITECQSRGIGFLCTAFDPEWVDYFADKGMDRIKIASGELTNTPALRHFAGTGLPILLSTGMATLEEVEEAVSTLREAGATDITLLHCTSLYPAPMETLNLRAIPAMAEHFALPVGFSDHSLGDQAAVAAVALGACIVEKHFTLDRALQGPDHRASLEPGELAEMVVKLRDTSLALGDGRKQPAPGERETAQKVRRSWHAARELTAGHAISEGDIVLKRPAGGLPPAISPVGARLRKALVRDSAIMQSDLDEPAT